MKLNAALLFILSCLMFLSCRNQYTYEDSNNLNCSIEDIADTILKLDSLVYRLKFTDRISALKLARVALRISDTANATTRILTMNMMGNAFNQYNVDSCYFYYAQAHQLAAQTGTLSCFPQLFYNLGILYYQAFDFRTAVTLLDSAINSGRRHRKWDVVVDAYNILGHIKKEIGLANEAKAFYELAIKHAKENGLNKQLGVAIAGLATFENDPNCEVMYYRDAIRSLMMSQGNEEVLASLYCNIGFLMTNPDSALNYYYKALQIGKTAKVNEILLSTWNNIAYSYLDKNDFKSALMILGDSALPLAIKDSNTAQMANLYDSYAEAIEYTGQYKSAYHYLRLAFDLKTKADIIKANEQSRLLMTLLETRNRELLIERQKIDLQRQQSLTDRYRVYFLFTCMGVAILFFVLIWYRQRTKYRFDLIRLNSARRIIENEEHEKNSTAMELHDISTEISMGLMRLVEEIPLPDKLYREKLTQGIDKVRQSIRNLSHAMHSGIISSDHLSQKITALCKEFSHQGIIHLDWAVGGEIPEADPVSELHCYRIIQELLINAVKHAPGSNVELDIYHTELLHINYQDDGPGFDPAQRNKSLGILNIRDRTIIMHGTATLSSEVGSGTTWEITLPLNFSNKRKLHL